MSFADRQLVLIIRAGWQLLNFAPGKKINLDEALTWADVAISGQFIGQEDFSSLTNKSSRP